MSADEEPDEADVQEEHSWDKACQREEAIRNLLRRHPERLTHASVDDVAGQLGLSRASLYRLIQRFRADGTVTALMPRTTGRPKGLRLLDAKREAVIRQAMNDFYLKPTKPPFARLVYEIEARCVEQGLPPPNWRTIKRRLLEIDLRTRAKRRGDAAVLKATAATPGSYTASRPLEVVQIDHTKVALPRFAWIMPRSERAGAAGRSRRGRSFAAWSA